MFFRTHPRFLFVLGDDGAMLVDSASSEQIFAAANDSEARHDIQARLAENPAAGVTALINGAAQDFRVETLPPVNFFDRGKLIRRRLQQAFPLAFAAAYRSVDSTHVVLAGVKQVGTLANWDVFLSDRKLRLGSLPVEGAGMILALLPDADKGWAMLLANFKTGGLRQIVTCDGRLVFTRQTPLPPEPAVSLQRVIDDTRGYLSRFGLNESAPLWIAGILGESLQKKAAVPSLICFSPRDAAEKLGLPYLPSGQEESADLVFAGWIAAQKKLWLPLSKKMPPDAGRAKRDIFVAKMGMRVAVLAFLTALAVTGWNLASLAENIYSNSRKEESTAKFRQQFAARQAALSLDAKPLARLRSALERQRIFAEPQPEPWAELKILGKALEGKAQVTRLEWRDDGALRFDMNLRGMDREAVLQDFKRMVGEMSRRIPDYSFEVSRYPFPVLPEETLTNMGDDKAAEKPAASLMMRRRT